ncbi:MAG TPA: polyprenyl diphosphate synthase [Candidatus Paceibacterota bacterium]|uniref:Isoprenyl transferase n=1 Tax=Candidatus Doudnabacteria bacterium RIFCSPHIGHO2_01_52_17 TaxID=1817820 RepID=A0A1F5NB55_9BACT|nr:MAG: di-trans,poly-cis-decaprenylcistransferase [Candidatus Doudnabacteria bacterium RIFCSPHIGHO2_01_52_17]
MKLNHVAIIPDGNRRWAKEQSLRPTAGHEKGFEIFKDVAREARKLGIPYLTAWGLSRDNTLKRSVRELKFLYTRFQENFEKLLQDKELHEDKVKVRVLGEWPRFFPSRLKTVIGKLEETTKNYSKFNLTFLLAYDGRREMAEAFRRAQEEAEIKNSKLKKYLWTKDLPPVDLVIRTGGNPHWSAGFLMWHTADSEFYFTKTFWPAFSTKEFKAATEEYLRRPRNLGA